MFFRKKISKQRLKVLIFLVLVITASISSCSAIKEILRIFHTVHKNTIELKVMTYNIYRKNSNDPDERRWANRRDQVVNNIKNCSADVFGVQEAYRSQVNFLLDQLPNYNWYGVGRNDGNNSGEHCAIFYRKDRFHVESEGTFWFSETPDIPSKGGDNWGNPAHKRICSWVQLIETDTKKAFYFYNLHLAHDSHIARKRSVELLGERINIRNNQDNSFIAVGDFNAKPTNEEILYLTDDLCYIDSYANTNENLEDGYTFVGWSGEIKKRIDYIFTHSEALLTTSYVVKRDGSDHFPVVTKLLIPIKGSE